MADPVGPDGEVSPAQGADRPAAGEVDVFTAVAGQGRAMAELRAALTAPVHAYLLVGPPGSGKRRAAQAFAAGLLCDSGGCGRCQICARVTAGAHPDVVLVKREGPGISVGTAREIRRLALRTANEGGRKVLILHEFHLVINEAASTLLKVVEEPPPGTVFVILADHLPPELVTIASRCVQIGFGALPDVEITALLVADGIEPEAAALATAGAGGRLDRARLLAGDAGFAARLGVWRSVPGRLDGTGATVSVLAAELVELLASAAVEPLKLRHTAELAELAERVERSGERGSGRKDLDDRHRRELRRLRVDELGFGLGILAGVYRDAALETVDDGRLGGSAGRPAALLAAVDTIQSVADSLEHNPGELLLLQALLLRLPPSAVSVVR